LKYLKTDGISSDNSGHNLSGEANDHPWSGFCSGVGGGVAGSASATPNVLIC